MSDRVVRDLTKDEYRDAEQLFRAALHVPMLTDDQWATAERSYQPGRTIGAFDAAIADLDQLLRLEGPWDTKFLWMRGHIHLQRGDPERALADYRMVRRCDPNDERIGRDPAEAV
jgi:tetratricopeptide (TPR) repeat protein